MGDQDFVPSTFGGMEINLLTSNEVQVEECLFADRIGELNSGNNVTVQSNTVFLDKIGIGVTATTYPLEVNGTIQCETLRSTSDKRYKTNIQNVDSSFSLDLINNLSIKKYQIISDEKKLNHYGLIAQDINQILPDVVQKSKNVIPNIFEECNVEYISYGIYKILLDKKFNIVLNSDTICLILNNKKKFFHVNEITSKYIIINTYYSLDKKIFVFGQVVEDFCSINYLNIHNLLISSVQELTKIVNKQQEEIDILKQKL